MVSLYDPNDLRSIKGIGEKLSIQLNGIGIKTVSDLMNVDEKQLINGGITKLKANKIMSEIRYRKLGDFITAAEFLDLRKKLPVISTGVKSLDKMLGGGIETGDITGFWGEFRTGKTQLCHQLCVMAQLPIDMGGLKDDVDVHVIYIDTEKSFRPLRIAKIVEANQYGDANDFLRNIHVAFANNSDDQMLFAQSISDRFSDCFVGLIIVDSLMGKFRDEYIGRENLPVRQSLLSKHLSNLQRIADKGCAVVVTNQVSSKPDLVFGDPMIPIGGNTVNHRIQTYIRLMYLSGGRRKAKVTDSPMLPESECIFRIVDGGVADE